MARLLVTQWEKKGAADPFRKCWWKWIHIYPDLGTWKLCVGIELRKRATKGRNKTARKVWKRREPPLAQAILQEPGERVRSVTLAGQVKQ